MTTTVTVSIAVSQITGAALPLGRVRFELTGADINSGIIAPAGTEVTLGSDGTGTASLWPNALGTRGTQYRVTIFSAAGDLQFSGLATIPASNCNLHSVLNLDAPGVVSDVSAHIANATDAHDASAISVTAISGRTAVNAQTMLAEISAAVSAASGATNLAYTASATNGIVTSNTGTDATLPLADGTNAGLMAPAQVTKLTGVATGATANSSDATLLARANHTGTQAAATISDFSTAADARIAAAVGVSVQANLGFTAENAANKNASGGYAGLTLFKLNLVNALGTITSWFTTAATVARTWTMPDKDGTVAMISDVTNHTGDATDAHAASAIGNTPAGNIAATDVQAALNELDTEKQATLVSATNIKTINSTSLLGAGDLVISASPAGAGTELQYRNAGAFGAMSGTAWDGTNRSLTITGATVTTSNPIFNLSQIWNAGAVTFTGFKLNVTNTASATASLLADFQVGGTSIFSVSRLGVLTLNEPAITYVSKITTGANYLELNVESAKRPTMLRQIGWTLNSSAGIRWVASTTDPTGSTYTAGVDYNAADIVEINSGTKGTFRDLKLRGLWFGSTLTVGTLPSAAASEGLIYRVSDSNAPAVGATVAAGGSTKCTVQSNATNWVVVWI